MTIECSQSVHSIVLRSGIRGLSAILSKVQIHLRDSFQRRKNWRNQNARRLDAVQTEITGLYCAFLSHQLRKEELQMKKLNENDILETTLSIAEKGYPEAYQFLLNAYEESPTGWKLSIRR